MSAVGPHLSQLLTPYQILETQQINAQLMVSRIVLLEVIG